MYHRDPGVFTLERYEGRFLRQPNGCWEWIGPFYWDGYGAAYDPRVQKTKRAHRVLYELTVGPIPEGLTIDHRCNNKRCVNGAHMEPVTLAENLRRRLPPPPTCPSGHPFDEANTRRNKKGQRLCRTCVNAHQAAIHARYKTDSPEKIAARRERDRIAAKRYRETHRERF